MANLTAGLTISGDKQYAFSSTKTYNQVFNIEQELDNSDSFIRLTAFQPDTTAKAQGVLQDAKFVCINNPSNQTIEVVIVVAGITSLATDTTGGTDANIMMVLRPNEFFILPSVMFVNNDALESATNATEIVFNNDAPAAAGHVDTGIDIDNTTATNNVVGNASNTLVYLEQYTSATNCGANFFKVGDLIRINSEIMEVTAIGDKSDLANNTLTVKRGMFGTTAADDHADDAAVSLAYFNGFQDTINMVKTDLSGNYKANNLLGKGRQLVTNKMDGWNRGTIAVKFYTEGGYQELGMSNVTANTNSGLAASTTYQFNITVDGGSTFVDLAFTTDATNLNFGGPQGVIEKINAALREQYYTSGNLFEKSVTVSIVNGDIRFQSNSNNSATAILLAAPGSGTTPFGVGRIPAIGDITEAIASKLPEDTITRDGVSAPNTPAFMFDDGNGRLISGEGLGGAAGTIDYDTGAITILNGPIDADFVVTGISGGGLACGGNSGENSVMSIRARSVSSKRNAKVQVLAFD
tara:strand:- start:4 stop:1572 length:1569 start_codon:yes stop_codon:yes gene_type:complete